MHPNHCAHPSQSSGADSIALRRWRFEVRRIERIGLVTQSSVRSDRLDRDVLEIVPRQVFGQTNNRSQQWLVLASSSLASSTHQIYPRMVSAVRPRRHASNDPKPGGRKPCPHGPVTFSTEAPGHTSQAPGQRPEDLGAVTADTNRWTRGFYTPGQRVLPRCVYIEDRPPSPDQSSSRI